MKTIRVLSALAILLTFGGWESTKIESGVNWMTFEEATALHKHNPKKLLIDLYTSWCGWCKVMDKKTYSNEEIARYINKNFYPIKFDAESKNAVEFNGRTFEYLPNAGRRGVHSVALAVTGNNLTGYPMTVFMDENLKIIQPISGYLKPAKLERILLYIGGDHFKTTPWEDFRKNNKSSL